MTDSVAEGHALHHWRGQPDRSVWYAGYLLTFLATAEETGGRFSLVEALGRRGLSDEPPPHIQTREEESFYIIEGQMSFFVAGEIIRARAGTLVTLPRGVPHHFTIDSDEVRYLNLCTPAGFEGFFRDLSEPALKMTLPPPSTEPRDIPRLIAVAEKCGVQILPPE